MILKVSFDLLLDLLAEFVMLCLLLNNEVSNRDRLFGTFSVKNTSIIRFAALLPTVLYLVTMFIKSTNGAKRTSLNLPLLVARLSPLFLLIIYSFKIFRRRQKQAAENLTKIFSEFSNIEMSSKNCDVVPETPEASKVCRRSSRRSTIANTKTTFAFSKHIAATPDPDSPKKDRQSRTLISESPYSQLNGSPMNDLSKRAADLGISSESPIIKSTKNHPMFNCKKRGGSQILVDGKTAEIFLKLFSICDNLDSFP